MHLRLAWVLSLVLFSPAALWPQSTIANLVRFHTNLGDIDVTLLPNDAPQTVANFMNYVNRGVYANSLIHRSVPDFIIQGGGFQLKDHSFVEIPADPAVRNEYKISNTRGTIAMAKLGNDPNSATSQWFFNLGDNSRNLDLQNGGFTVFGRVANNDSMAILDKIAAVPAGGPYSSPFDQIPLQNWAGGNVLDQNLVLVLKVTVLNSQANSSMGIDAVSTAGEFGGRAEATAGSFIEINGSSLAGTTRAWNDTDFMDGYAPIILDGVTATVNNQPAYLSYVSPSRVKVQVPVDVPVTGTVPVTVTYKRVTSSAGSLTLKPLAAALLAPPSYKVDDKQFVSAVHAEGGAPVSNGAIPDVPKAPAAPGETIVLTGTGFGPVDPATIPIAGEIVRLENSLANPVQFNIGGSPAEVVSAGLAKDSTGRYEFRIVVPRDAADGDLPLEAIQAGETLPQKLFLPVKTPSN